MATVSAVGQNGCIVVIITGAALGLGLWLDVHFNTKPLFALCLILASMPLSLFIVWRFTMTLVKRIARLLDTNPQAKKDDS